MPRKNGENSSTLIKNSKVKINDLHKLDEEDDEGYPPIDYSENYKRTESDSSDDDILRQNQKNQSKQTQQSNHKPPQHQVSIEIQKPSIGTKSSIYARAQQQQQPQTDQSIKRRTSLEHIQDKFKLQIERKLKMKESLNPSQFNMLSKQKIDEESQRNTRVNIPDSGRETQTNITYTKKESAIMSLRGSQKNISEAVSQNSVKNSMVEVMNIQLTEMSDARRRDFEMKKMKQQEQDIKDDRTITEDQRKVKLDNLKHSLIVDRVKNIIEKTKKMKEQQYKPAKREQRFEMQLNIFKKLDTYLETKGYLQKVNLMSDDKQLQDKSKEANPVTKRKKKEKKDVKIYQTSSSIAQNEDFQIPFIQNILNKTYKYLNKNNETILKQDSVLGGDFLQELQRNIFGQSFQEDQDELEEVKRFSKKNYENISSTENQTDTNAFYNILQYQLESGYFSKVDPDKKKTEQSSSLEPAQEDHLIEEVVNEKVVVDKKRKFETKLDELEEYRKKAKKITKLLLHTSKNILKKNIEENSNAIIQARKARVNQKIQQQLNIKSLERSIKKIPGKLEKLQQGEPGELTTQQRINEAINEKLEKQEEEKERNRLMNEMLPEKRTSKRRNIDTKLQDLEESLSSLNTSSMVSSDVQKIRQSFDRRFSMNNEQKGITVPAQKQSKFSKLGQAVTPNLKTEDGNQFIFPLLRDDSNSEASPINSPLLKQSQSQNNRVSNSVTFNDKNKIFTINNQGLDNVLKKQDNSPFDTILNKEVIGPYGRVRRITEDSNFSKTSGIQSVTHKKQTSLLFQGTRSPASNLNHTGLSTEVSPILMGLSSKRDFLSKNPLRLRSDTVTNNIFSKDNTLNEKISKVNKQNGFNVMDIKQIVQEMKEKEDKMRNKNKFKRLNMSNNINKVNPQSKAQSFSQQMLQPLSQQIGQHQFIQPNQLFSLAKTNNLEKKPTFNQQTNSPRENNDIFQSLKSQLSQKFISKQSIPTNIFITENPDLSPTKRGLTSERNLICNFLPSLQSKRSISGSNDKMFQYSKTHDNESNSQKQLSRSSSSNIQQNQIVETNKQLEQIMNNINHFKISFKNDKGYINKQISDMQLKLEKQQESVTPQPLESLRMCFDIPTPYTSKIYVYDRKAVQKIL